MINLKKKLNDMESNDDFNIIILLKQLWAKFVFSYQIYFHNTLIFVLIFTLPAAATYALFSKIFDHFSRLTILTQCPMCPSSDMITFQDIDLHDKLKAVDIIHSHYVVGFENKVFFSNKNRVS